jgi:hypothetical protein
MNRIRQAIATLGHQPPGSIQKRIQTRIAVATAALVIPLAVGLAGATSASASPLPPLSLTLSSNSYDDWVASGISYTPGLTDVQLWVEDVTTGQWTTLEYQSGLHTTSRAVSCVNHSCRVYLGGSLHTQGASYYVPGAPGGFPGYWQAVHPLQCGQSYQAITQNPSDGWVYSNILTEPACQTTS